MKVLLAANTSWYLYNFRAKTIQALIQKGHEVICVAPIDESSHSVEALGVTFYPLNLDGASTDPLTEIKTLVAAILLLHRIRPDFVFNFTIKVNSYFGLAALWAAVPYANNVSGLGTAFIHQSLAYRFARYLYGISNRRARKVFFQNQEDRELFISNGLAVAETTVLLPGSGVDVERFKFSPMLALRGSYESGTGKRGGMYFLMIARLIGDKGVREFVDAARIVRHCFPDTRFVLLGPSGISNKTAISNGEIEAWRNDAIVELVGEQSDVIPWLRACHVLVLPSYREGMPRTVLEAASIGRPAIVSDVPGCRQAIIDKDTGWLCEVRSAESLASTMTQVITKAEQDFEWLQNFGVRAAVRIRREFSDALVVSAYLECLEEETGPHT